MPNNEQYSLDIRVYYEDTDAGGIVFYANYLKFFERARTEWLRALDVDQELLLAQNIGFVVRRVEMDNLLAGKFNQLLTVHCKVVQMRRASLVFEQHITNSEGQTICTAIVTIACVDLSKMKPMPIPAFITEVLKVVS